MLPNADPFIDSGYAFWTPHWVKQGWRPPSCRLKGGDGSCGSSGGRQPGTQSSAKWENRGSAACRHAAPATPARQGTCVVGPFWPWLTCLPASLPSRPRVPRPSSGVRMPSCRPGPKSSSVSRLLARRVGNGPRQVLAATTRPRVLSDDDRGLTLDLTADLSWCRPGPASRLRSDGY